MRTEEVIISNGTLAIPRNIRSSMNLKDGATVLLDANEDGSITIRKKDTIANLKGIIKKGENPDLRTNGSYQFETTSKRQEK